MNDGTAQNGGDRASRAAWMRLSRKESERLGVGWAVWEDDKTLQLFNPSTGVWDSTLTAALFD
jgi:hypothetical protein